MTSARRPSLLIVDHRTAVRGAIREFIEATTPYKVCDAVDDGVSAIHKAMGGSLRPNTPQSQGAATR